MRDVLCALVSWNQNHLVGWILRPRLGYRRRDYRANIKRRNNVKVTRRFFKGRGGGGEGGGCVGGACVIHNSEKDYRYLQKGPLHSLHSADSRREVVYGKPFYHLFCKSDI